MKKNKIILSVLLSSIILSAHAATHYQPGKRAQLPSAFINSYFGMGIGYTDIPFSNKNLLNNFQARSFSNPSVGLNAFVGHYFNPYIAAQISLMRPIKWAYANNVSGSPDKRNSIWISLFGFSVRPTWPISSRVNLYGLAGLGVASRHGFSVNGVTAMPSKVIPTFLTGGGVSYALTSHWHLQAGVDYALARPSKQLPSMLYAYTGFYYLFQKLHLPDYYTTSYIFPKNIIEVGGFKTSVFNPNINKYFGVHYLPIFWTGDVRTRNGAMLLYQRNIFHTHKRFSLDVGASVSTYHSARNNTSFETFSIFPDVRAWLVRSKTVDFYFMYSVAGPSYITRRTIDNIDTGGHFTFQDLMGVGFFFGKEKNINLDLRIGHYSNGNSLPNNPGIQVPLTVSAGYAFE